MLRFAAILALAAALALPVGALGWGGRYPTGGGDGTSIHVEVSGTYRGRSALPRRWAAFVGTLLHGSELWSLRLRLEPRVAVEQVCGRGSPACYNPRTRTLLASPDPGLRNAHSRQVVAHEYAHHIANFRSNAPWRAEDTGTKRWASYEQVCSRTAAGLADPGAETSNYPINPGEAFAETYRVLDLRRRGQKAFSWIAIVPMFRPDATALRLLQEDVLHPWTGPTRRRVKGAGSTTLALETPLDGTFTVRLRAPAASAARVALYAGARRLRRPATGLAYRVCGARKLTLRVTALGSWTLDLSKP